MGEAGGQLQSLPRDLVHEDEIEEEEVIMNSSSPDRPPGVSPGMQRAAGELDLNCPAKQGNVNGEELHSSARLHCDKAALQDGIPHSEFATNSTRGSSQLAEKMQGSVENGISLPEREVGSLRPEATDSQPSEPELNAAPSHQDREHRGRSRRTRWDPAPAKQAPEVANNTTCDLGNQRVADTAAMHEDTARQQLDSGHRRRVSVHYGSANGFSDNAKWDGDSRSRRHTERRSVTMQAGFRKDNYYRNEGKSGFDQQPHRSSYDRGGSTSSLYDRGAHRFGGRNGFERRGDWSSRRVQDSRDRRDWSRPDREGYDCRDRRSDREGFDYRDRRDWVRTDRSSDRDRRQSRDSEEWHSLDNLNIHRNAGSQWQGAQIMDATRFNGVHAAQIVAFPAFQANEPAVFSAHMPPLVSSNHILSEHVPQSSHVLQFPPAGQALPVLPNHVPSEPVSDSQQIYVGYQQEEQEPGQLPDEEEEPKTNKGWVYINENGDFQGPMELAALKLLSSNGFMQEDHLVMRSGTNEWVTLEHAQSPENASAYMAEYYGAPVHPSYCGIRNPDKHAPTHQEHKVVAVAVRSNEASFQRKDDNELSGCFDIEERVEHIMKDYPLDPGDELKSVWAALSVQRHEFDADNSSDEDSPHYLSNPWKDSYQLGFGVDFDLEKLHGNIARTAAVEEPLPVPMDPPDNSSPLKFVQEKWTCTGGDWKLVHPEGQSYKKVVLNNGSLLCELRHSGADPRRQNQQSDTSKRKKLELPQWAAGLNHKTDASIENTSTKSKSALHPSTPKVTRTLDKALGNKPPDHGKDFHNRGKPVLPLPKKSGAVDVRVDKSKLSREHDTGIPDKRISNATTTLDKCSLKIGRPAAPFADIRAKCKSDLGKGDWYYKDGSGREHGPYSFIDLQSMVAREMLMEGISVYRKSDDVWVPLPRSEVEDGNKASDGGRRPSHLKRIITTNIQQTIMGYTNGQLHEHVMKHYKNQVLSAFLFEGLDARAKLIESSRRLSACSTVAILGEDTLPGLHGMSASHLSPTSSNETSDDLLREDGENYQSRTKRAFKTLHGSGGNDQQTSKRRRLVYTDDFESSDNDFHEDKTAETNQTWRTLQPSILMRVYHHFEGDLKSLCSVSATCSAWRVAAQKFKPKVNCLDLTSMGPRCTDAVFDLVQGYGAGKIKQVILRDCTMLSAEALGKFLERHPSVSDVDINGCDQFGELIQSFPRVNWVYHNGDSDGSDSATQGSEDSHRKMKSLKLIGASSTRKPKVDKEEDGDEVEPMDIDPSYSNEHDFESITQHSGFKRVKLSTGGKALKSIHENGYLKGRKNSDEFKRKNTVASKGLNRAGSARRSAKGMVTISSYEGLDQGLASALKQLVNSDTSRWFYQKAGQRMDLATMEKKLHDGLYSGSRAAFSAFKADLCLIQRWALKMEKDTPQYIAGQKIASATERLLNSLEDTYFPKIVSEHEKLLTNGYAVKGKNQKRSRDDQQKGKTAIKKRKLGARHWSGSESDTSDEDDLLYEAGEETGSETGSEPGVTDVAVEYETQTCDVLTREWGARMTKAAMVPPLTRKYEVIHDYSVVIDKELVERKMKVEVPDDYEEKLRASKQKRGGEYSHLEVPDIKDSRPRRELGIEVLEQEVYGIDPYTHNLLLDTIPKYPVLTDAEKRQFVEEKVLQALNKEVKQFTGSGKAPMEYPLEPVIQRILDEAQDACDVPLQQISQGLLRNMHNRPRDKYVSYRKGLGVVCNKKGGFKEDDFVVEFLGEVYPAWRWFEKQDACRSLQKKDKDPAPEFYNIFLERPKGDAAGYDLLVVDAMHKANYASRICHSCRPNCEAKVTAVNKRYTIGVYTLRPIQDGEELTFDYNSVTESKEEYNNSICLCGSQGCRGSYLNLAGADTFQEVMKECHGLLDRHALLLEACCDGPVTKLELDEMNQAGVGSCLLDGLPDWLLKYTARLIEFINLERQRLPDELMRSVKKKKKEAEFIYELDRADAEVQAEGIFNSRLQNLAITLDKVRYVLRQLFTDPREAPPLLKKLDQKELVTRLWSDDNSILNELLRCMTPHIPQDKLSELKCQIQDHSPDERGDGRSLRESLLWLRDKLRTLEPTFLSRHDAAADLIHMYAYTQCFFTCEEYGTFESPPLQINALDLGRHTNAAPYTWKKIYNKEYVLGQLINWFKQTAADPGASLVQARRGCLVLPDFSSCYAKGLQQDSRRAYGSRLREEMFPRMERWPQKQWPKSQFWEFKSNRGLFGSPMLDTVQRGGRIDVEMMHWLKTRPVNFVGPYDEQ